MTICKNCGNQNEDGIKFCPKCGHQIESAIPDTNPENFSGANKVESSTDDFKEKADSKKKKNKKWFAIGGIGFAVIAIILAAVIAIPRFFPSIDKKANETLVNDNYALFLKENEIFYTKLNSIEPLQITHDLINTDSEEDSEKEDYFLSDSLGRKTLLSEDGKKLFYVDKYIEDEVGFSMYYKMIDKPDEEPIKLDSNVTYFSINKNADLVTYIKGEEGALYQHNLQEKTKIANDVYKFYSTDDGSKLIFCTTDDGVYVKNTGTDKEKIASDANIQYVSDDLSTIYYVDKENSLYIKKDGQDKIKIDTDVSYLVQKYNADCFYYTRDESFEITMYDYINDDLLDSDSKLSSYPEKEDFDFYFEWTAAYDKVQEQNEAANERNDLRNRMKEYKITIDNNALYYYDGSDSKKVSDSYYQGSANSNNAVLVFNEIDRKNTSKLKMSEITEISSAERDIKSMFDNQTKWKVAIKENVLDFDQSGVSFCKMNEDATIIYFFDDARDEYADLYKMEISDNKIASVELYDSDVSIWNNSTCYFMDDGSFVYYKDVKDSIGDLYINKKCIDYDVYVNSVNYDKKSQRLLYLTDYSTSKHYGTMKIYDGSESVRIADDVSTFYIMPDNSILYLYDYSMTSHCGELRRYNAKESVKIADDVMAIIPLYDYKSSTQAQRYAGYDFD